MPPERTPRRQEPASCQSCRKKKLRCDRALPCHNCQTRAIQCQYEGRRPPDGSEISPEASDLRAENASIKARLKRLEEIILNGEANADGTSATTIAGFRSPPITTEANTPEAEQTKGYSDDSRWLESVAARGSSQFPQLGNNIRVQIEPLISIVATTTDVLLAPQHIKVPSLAEAVTLLQYYLDHVDCLQHIIYVPTVRARVYELYDALGKGQLPVPSHLALLLTILANIGGFWALGSSPIEVFTSQEDALALSTYWLRCTLDVLEHIWRTSTADLELIQASIMSLFLVYHMEGFSAKMRRLHVSALSSAKDLGLHLTDSKVREDTQEQIIEADMRRRIWWHLASTDWSLSLCGGPHDGTYSVQRKHMQVKQPRNVNDSDLATMPADFERPMSEATDATYYLGRIRLGETCREAADITWELNAVQDPEQIPYQRIKDLDRRFGDLLTGLPPGMNMDDDDTLNTAQMGHNCLQLAKQRYFTFLTVQTRRCKLHLPFLLRAQRRPEYRFSRDVCLEAARHVIALKHVLPFQNIERQGTIKMIGLLHHFYCAIVVLVMDLCVNRDVAKDIHERKVEIREALAIFEDAKVTSTAAGCFLEALSAMLQKHNVLHGTQTRSTQAEPPMATTMCYNQSSNSETHAAGQRIGTFGDNLGIEDISFDDTWQSYFDFGTNPLEPTAWDALFNYEQDMAMPA